MVALSVEDISKMKIADLKKELKALGLSVDGKKNELQERLEEALSAGDEVEEAEENSPQKAAKRKSVEFTGNDEVVEPEEQKENKYESITAPSAEEETKVKTAQELADEAKIAARIARWGVVEPPAKKKKEADSESKENKKEKVNKRGPKIKMAPEDIDIEKLKSRAARFGDACPKDLTELEKKLERAERFKNGTADEETNGKAEEVVAENGS